LNPGDAGPVEEEDAAKRFSAPKNAALAFGTNIAVAFLTLANATIMARALGATGRGDVAFLITVASMTAYIASLSVQESNGNLAGTHPALRPVLATNSLIMAVLFGLGGAALVLGFVAVFPRLGGEVDRVLLWAALGALPIVILKNYLQYLVQADYSFAVTNTAWLLGPVTTSLLNGTQAALGVLTVTSALTAWIIGQSLGTLLLVYYVARHAGFGRADLRLSLRATSFGLKSHVSQFMGVGNYRADQWFVGSAAGSKELGIYSVAVAWAEMLYYLPGVLVMIQRPVLVRATPAEAAAFAIRVFRAALILAAGLAVVLLVGAPFLCVTIFGEEFRGAIEQLRILALAAFGIVTLELLSAALIAQRRPWRASASVACAFVVTIGLGFALIPTYEGLGAAIARTAAYTVGGAAALLIFTRTLESRASDLLPRIGDVWWFWTKLTARFARG